MTNNDDLVETNETERLAQDPHDHDQEKNLPIPLIWRLLAIGVAAIIIIALLYPQFNQSDQQTSTLPPAVGEPAQPADNNAAEPQKSVETLFKEGQQYYNNGQWGLAIDTYKQVIALDPEYQSAYVNLGDAYYKSEQLDLAIETYLKGAEIDPDDADVAYNLGAAYLQQALVSGTPDPDGMAKAIAQIKMASELDPELPHPHYGLGAAYQIMGDIPLAITHFETFLELDDGSDSRATSEAQNILDQLKALQSQ